MPRKSSDSNYYTDREAADRAVTFFEAYLTHSKGEWAGQPFVLAPWQAKLIRTLFGTKAKATGLRRYRKVYVEVPRKNGKSTLGAGIGLYLLLADQESGAEVYSCAADREQASLVFDEARRMVDANRDLQQRCAVYRRVISVQATQSTYKVLSADAYSKHGLNVHGVIFDELHAQPNRDLYDVLTTSTGARRQPLEFYITTAGFDRHSICYELHEYALRVQKGIVKDDAFLPCIYAAAETDDWTSPAVWKKANPNLGVTLKPEYLRGECERAQELPSYENTFRMLHLNQWVKQESRWLPMEKWNACPSALDEDALQGRVCYAGLDLSTTTDLTALVYVFPIDDQYHVLPRFFLPSEAMRARSRRDKVPYDVWVDQGLMTATEGNVVDYEYILKQIDTDARQFDIQAVAFDRWGASRIIQQLQQQEMTVLEFGQGFVSMNRPCKELLQLVLNGSLCHPHTACLNWQADNAVVELDAAGNIKLSKRKSVERIDGMVALTMALDICQRKPVLDEASRYETQELVML